MGAAFRSEHLASRPASGIPGGPSPRPQRFRSLCRSGMRRLRAAPGRSGRGEPPVPLPKAGRRLPSTASARTIRARGDVCRRWPSAFPSGCACAFSISSPGAARYGPGGKGGGHAVIRHVSIDAGASETAWKALRWSCRSSGGPRSGRRRCFPTCAYPQLTRSIFPHPCEGIGGGSGSWKFTFRRSRSSSPSVIPRCSWSAASSSSSGRRASYCSTPPRLARG